MKRVFTFVLWILMAVLSKAQVSHSDITSSIYNNVYIDRNDDGSIIQKNMVAYKMDLKNDTIEFLRADDTNQKLPVFVFIQGSQPIPLIMNFGNKLTAAFLYNLDNTILSNYHVIEIATPNTPLYCDSTSLDDQCRYVPTGEPTGFDPIYIKRNHLSTYTERANAVIDYIATQQWADKNNIIVFGHSQGAYIAAALAAQNKHVSVLGLASFCPLGRMQGQVIEARLNAIARKTTMQQSSERITEISDYWKYLQSADDEEYQKQRKGDLPSTTKSFSRPVFEEISRLRQPVFIAYGTSDYHCILCDLFPLYFAQNKKENYEILPMNNRGHNFEMINQDGSHDWEDVKWHEVTAAFARFIEKTKD